MKKVLLVSGGLDSMLIYAEKKHLIDYLVYFDYGHRFMAQELACLDKQKVPYRIVKMRELPEKNGWFFGRNLAFLIACREAFLSEDIAVYVGTNADDCYTDNAFEFMQRAEKIINDSYVTNTMRVVCPLKDMTKQEIISKARQLGVGFYFCDSGEADACGKCHSCVAMQDAGYAFKE